jgi:nucleoside 2-deoxyribosyltransferase
LPKEEAVKRVYLASRFDRQEELRAIAEMMTVEGYIITSRWLYHTGGLSIGPGKDSAIAAAWAEKDLDDVALADTLVLFTDDKPVSRGGSNVELGYALALGHQSIVVGPRVNVFHHKVGVMWIPTMAEFRERFCGLPKVVEL